MKILYFSNVGNSDLGLRENDKPLPLKKEEIYEKTKEMFINKDFSLEGHKPLLIEDQIEKIFENFFDRVEEFKVILFATEQNPINTQDTKYVAEIIKELLKEKFGDFISVEIYTINTNPSDYDKMNDFFIDHLNNKKFDKYNKIFINITGGTPACISNLLMISTARWGNKISVLYKPRDKESQKLDISKKVYNIYQEKQYEILKERGFYALAAEKIKEINGNIENSLYFYLMGLHHFYLFNFDYAKEFFEKAKENIDLDKEKIIEINEKLRLINKIEKEQDKVAKILILIDNTLHKYNNEEYVDFIGRVFRLKEALLRFIFEDYTGVSTDKTKEGFVEFEKFLEEREDIVRYLKEKTKWDGTKKPTVWVLHNIIKYLFKNGKMDKKRYGLLFGFLESIEKAKLEEIRNKSIIAHGFRGVKKEDIPEELINRLTKLSGWLSNAKNFNTSSGK